jgi:energy-coupling factor transporter ATP-binding protein EcfA2
MLIAGADDSSSSSSDDEPEHSTFLVIGRSGTGKSSLCRSLLAEFKHFSKTVYVLNDRSKRSKYVRISWSQLGELHHCAVLVEDIVTASSAQFRQLAELLNFGVHHKRLSPTICVSHSLTRQGIFGLLPFFTRVYVSACVASLASFRNLLNYFGFEEAERQFHISNLLSNKEPFCHYMLDVEKRTVDKVHFPLQPDDDGGDGTGRKKKKKKKMSLSRRDALALSKAQRYLSVLKNSKECLALFDLIWHRLPKSADPATLEVSLQTKKGEGSPVKISLISYLAALTDDRGTAPAHDMIKFHKYCKIVHGIYLPAPFVLNKNFH